MIKTVRELIKALADFNPDAKVYIGDNINNHVTLSWGGCDGCDKENCSSVGFHNFLVQFEDQEDSETESGSFELPFEPDLSSPFRFFGETIVITDPCYMKSTRPVIKTSTIYGDWSCMVYPGKMGENKDPDKWDEKYFKYLCDCNQEHDEEEKERLRNDWKWFKRRWKEENTLGEFCADAGEVGVFEWNRLTDEEKKWIREHDWCAAVIKDVEGVVGFRTVTDNEGNRTRHVVCLGKTNFFSIQSGF